MFSLRNKKNISTFWMKKCLIWRHAGYHMFIKNEARILGSRNVTIAKKNTGKINTSVFMGNLRLYLLISRNGCSAVNLLNVFLYKLACVLHQCSERL